MSIVYSKVDVQRLDETGNERYISNDPPFHNQSSMIFQDEVSITICLRGFCEPGEAKRGQVGEGKCRNPLWKLYWPVRSKICRTH